MSKIQQKLADTIRVLSAEGVQAANSGHPGLPMGCADIASVLWSDFLTHDPVDADWANRDRFVLSAGHGSMLIYSLLHLFNYDVSLSDLQNFRQLGSKTPGHPEYGYTHGVETTTGPLGQGLANAVGMALAAKIQGEKYNTADHKIVDNTIYTLCGDGCMMEGIASEAASTAGHLQLDNLVFIYDSNRITIEGSTDISFTEDVAKRFEAYNFEVLLADGHNLEEISTALKAAKASNKPSLVICTTTIGKGSPNKSGTSKVHGAPLGTEETSATRVALGLGDDHFTVCDEVRNYAEGVNAEGSKARAEWESLYAAWASANPELKAEWDKSFSLEVPETIEFPTFETGGSIATRKSSEGALNAVATQVSYLYGGSADLDCSNLTRLQDKGDINTGEFAGRNLHFGVREHAMGAICNGMTLYGGMRVYCSTFLVFSDYMRHAIRLAALMKLPVIYIFTHDSIFVGEDGPTHQPIEHKAALECIPGLTVIRPADANEVTEAWELAIRKTDGPTALLMSRQGLKTLEASNQVNKGAYVVKKEKSENIDLILMASGSEVHHCLDAAEVLEAKGKSVRVVSVPSTELFQEQSAEYKESVLPNAVRNRFAVDYGTSYGWFRYIGIDGEYLCIDRFGESGPGGQVAEHFGFTTENIVARVDAYLA